MSKKDGYWSEHLLEIDLGVIALKYLRELVAMVEGNGQE